MKKKIIFLAMSLIFVGVISGVFVYNSNKAKASNEETVKQDNMPTVKYIDHYDYEYIKEDEVYKGELRGYNVHSKISEVSYAIDGKEQVDFTGVVDYEGATYYIKNGVYQKKFNGMVKDDKKGVYIFEGGHIKQYVNSIYECDGEEYIVYKGRALFGKQGFTGIVYFKNRYYLAKNSRIIKKYGKTADVKEGDYEGNEVIVHILH